VGVANRAAVRVMRSCALARVMSVAESGDCAAGGRCKFDARRRPLLLGLKPGVRDALFDSKDLLLFKVELGTEVASDGGCVRVAQGLLLIYRVGEYITLDGEGCRGADGSD
jgi:hypothetical protein